MKLNQKKVNNNLLHEKKTCENIIFKSILR